jgi:DNA-binding IclR family transcriptional regulator
MTDPPLHPAKPSYPITSVDNALKLLRMFGERRSIRVSEASTELGVVRSTAHRLLAMLQYHGFIEQDPDTKLYYPGPVLMDVALAAFREVDIRGSLRPLLESVAEEFQETVHLVTIHGKEVQFLDCVESPRNLRTSSRVGVALPAHCTAAGKVLLADLSTEQVRDIYPEPKLEQRTPESLARREDLEQELVAIRKTGYAVQIGESESDVAGVAALVRSTGRLRSAMAVTAPRSRLSRRQAAQLGKRLVALVDGAAVERS